MADKYGLGLVAYEGGQHLVGVAGGENNDALTKLLQAANRHPRMEGIYQRYFDGWRAAGGGLFCYFSSVGSWSKWGAGACWSTSTRIPPSHRSTVRCGPRRRLGDSVSVATDTRPITARELALVALAVLAIVAVVRRDIDPGQTLDGNYDPDTSVTFAAFEQRPALSEIVGWYTGDGPNQVHPTARCSTPCCASSTRCSAPWSGRTRWSVWRSWWAVPPAWVSCSGPADCRRPPQP
ncbi:MAG: hypothetical protein M5U09_26715 [Gammaproteobacteria bacterium]|nr:hypothetical protein [Gammaproteobacteria bacterium]